MPLLKVYQGHFAKKNGEIREMRFVRLNEVPPSLLPEKKGEQQPRQYKDGVELVWDLDKKGFRTFDWDSTVGFVVEKQENIDKLR